MKNVVAFVIDTDSYAGNFEREMCAHITGTIGDCEVGEELVEDGISKKFPNIQNVADDNGCYRPVSCHELPNSGVNNAVAIFFDINKPPSKEQIELMKERSGTFLEAYRNSSEWNKNATINITGFRLIEYKTTGTELPC